MNNKQYDYIFLGTGIISVLDAIYHKRSGHSVLMIEGEDNFGGAWRPIRIFDIEGVENAVHYFLFDKKSPIFMKNNLKWQIIKSTNKIRLLKFFKTNFYVKFKFHNPVGRFLSYLISYNKKKNKNILKFIYKIFLKIIKENSEHSFYIKGGSLEVFNSVKKLIEEEKLDIIYNTYINSIHVNSELKKVELTSSNKTFLAKKLIITHGSKINKISSPKKVLEINNKFHPRPAVHLLIKGKILSKENEFIFSNHPKIKYIHNITDTSEIKDKSYSIFVFALHPYIKEDQNIFMSLVKDLIILKIISKTSKLLNYKWTNTQLPNIHDSDLINIKNEFNSNIDYLLTDNFSVGIGKYSEKWSKVFKI